MPDFAKPPVNETVLSIQFAPLPNLLVPHFGLYWSRIRSNFPECQVHPEIAPVIEQFEGAQNRVKFGIQMLMQPTVRCWFMNNAENRLLQVQQDRFVHNWRQVRGDENYPRYPFLRGKLQAEWEQFCDFLESEKIGTPQVNQCEVTYVNHLEYGLGWNGYGELQRAISLWAGKGTIGFLPVPERIGIDVHYLLPDSLGRLHIGVQPVVRASDGNEVLQINITARGAPKSSSSEDILAWMDLGREWVVKGFADITTNAMHDIWGKRA